MKRSILFIISFILWLLITWSLNWQSVVIGVLVSLLTALFFGSVFSEEPKKWLQPRRYFWFMVYIPFFLWECLKANFDVAYRVLSPSMPIEPGIVKVKTILKSDIARTSLANSITMTPGTLTVDIKDEFLYIHWIYVRDKELEKATEALVRRFEGLLIKIFD